MSNYCFVAPILPGGEEKMKIWIRDQVNNNADHDRVMRQAGVTREQLWIQHTPMGDFAVASWETSDPGKTFQVVANSNDPWAARFRAMLTKAHGIDFSEAVPLNEADRRMAGAVKSSQLDLLIYYLRCEMFGWQLQYQPNFVYPALIKNFLKPPLGSDSLPPISTIPSVMIFASLSA